MKCPLFTEVITGVNKRTKLRFSQQQNKNGSKLHIKDTFHFICWTVYPERYSHCVCSALESENPVYKIKKVVLLNNLSHRKDVNHMHTMQVYFFKRHIHTKGWEWNVKKISEDI